MTNKNIPDWMKKKNEYHEKMKLDPFDYSGPVMSEEESRQRDEERIEKMITPELLTNFSEDETRNLVKYFEGIPSAQTCGPNNIYNFWDLSDEAKDFLKNELQGKKMIELGSASRDQAKIHFECDFKVKDYSYADPQYNTDGLSYLMKQPSNSAIVTSFGVLEDGVLYSDFKVPGLNKYTELLGQEIYRVTPKGAITLHGLEFDHDLTKTDFKEPENIPSDFNRELQQWRSLRVLRK